MNQVHSQLRFFAVSTSMASLIFAGAISWGGCGSNATDDDDERVIEPPEACANNSLANVTFAMTIHYGGEDYPPDQLHALVESWDPAYLSFPFLGEVTELGDDESGLLAVKITEMPEEGAAPLEDPNWVRVVYNLPFGYTLPVTRNDQVWAHIIIDYTSGSLISAFSLWEYFADADPVLLFMAEPSDIGLAYPPGDGSDGGVPHPAFKSITTRDRACPNLSALQCASAYNLSVIFESVIPITGDDDDSAGDDDDSASAADWQSETFELFPTEHRDFLVGDLPLRVVNVWSYAYREIDPDCSGFDWTAERFSYFVTRPEAAPQ